ncbi:MAG: exosortase-dependent surface protein XDP2, partial [Halieaceae bacterium]|nr:exosortase-dependent surface protein XDP2 [Halieaceae bacterium]
MSTPAGSTDTSNPFTDDVFLASLTFGGFDYTAAGESFRAVSHFEVLSGRSHINAEWGDGDTAADGNGTPFAKAGFPDADQETTDPSIQDAALLNAFNSLSLSEITDGENSAGSGFSFKVLFDGSLAYSDVGGDGLPDLVFFERGLNDTFYVDLIIGGSFANPLYSSPSEIKSGDFWDTGIDINTVEISNAQSLGAGGFDLADFGLTGNDVAYGFRLTAHGNSGPDLGGFFLTAQEPEDFGPSLVPVPQT